MSKSFGGEYRKEIYQIVENITGKPLSNFDHFILSTVLKEYASACMCENNKQEIGDIAHNNIFYGRAKKHSSTTQSPIA